MGLNEHICMVAIIPGRESVLFYALDENGAVWCYSRKFGWEAVPMPPRPEPPGPPAVVVSAVDESWIREHDAEMAAKGLG